MTCAMFVVALFFWEIGWLVGLLLELTSGFSLTSTVATAMELPVAEGAALLLRLLLEDMAGRLKQRLGRVDVAHHMLMVDCFFSWNPSFSNDSLENKTRSLVQ